MCVYECARMRMSGRLKVVGDEQIHIARGQLHCTKIILPQNSVARRQRHYSICLYQISWIDAWAPRTKYITFANNQFSLCRKSVYLLISWRWNTFDALSLPWLVPVESRLPKHPWTTVNSHVKWNENGCVTHVCSTAYEYV